MKCVTFTINWFKTCEMHTSANYLRKQILVDINYLLWTLHERASPNSLVMLEALLYFESRSLILVPNIRHVKHFFSVLVCYTRSAVYLAGRHKSKSRKLDLNWRFYDSRRILKPKAAKKGYLKWQICLRANLENTNWEATEGKLKNTVKQSKKNFRNNIKSQYIHTVQCMQVGSPFKSYCQQDTASLDLLWCVQPHF